MSLKDQDNLGVFMRHIIVFCCRSSRPSSSFYDGLQNLLHFKGLHIDRKGHIVDDDARESELGFAIRYDPSTRSAAMDLYCRIWCDEVRTRENARDLQEIIDCFEKDTKCFKKLKPYFKLLDDINHLMKLMDLRVQVRRLDGYNSDSIEASRRRLVNIAAKKELKQLQRKAIWKKIERLDCNSNAESIRQREELFEE